MWKYQVITIIDGDFRHEGFYDDERQANEMRDWIAQRMDYGGIEKGAVIVNKINYKALVGMDVPPVCRI